MPMNPTPNDVITSADEYQIDLAPAPSLGGNILLNITGNGQTKVYAAWPGILQKNWVRISDFNDGGMVWLDRYGSGNRIVLYNCDPNLIVGRIGVPPAPEKGLWASVRRFWAWLVSFFD